MPDKKPKTTKTAKPAAPKKAAADKSEVVKKKPAAPKAVKATAPSAEAKVVKKSAEKKTVKAAEVKAAPATAAAPAAAKPAASATAAPKPAAPAAPTTPISSKPAAVVSPAAAKPAPAPVAPVAPAAPAAKPVAAPAPAAVKPAVPPTPVSAPAPAVKPTPAPAPAASAPAAPAKPIAPQPQAPRPAAPIQQAPPVAPQRPAQPAPAAAPARPSFPPAAAPRPAAPAAAAPKPAAAPSAPALKSLEVATPITVRDLASAMEQKPTDVMAKMIKMGTMASLNQFLQFESAVKIAREFGYELEKPHELEENLSKFHRGTTDASKLVPRPPIVTFMGHVDHGKTSLLDAIRKTKVVDTESGGITQHIGAYEIFTEKGAVTFLDTPGHEAFTAMRARGARCTDIVVLVVAADASIQPQTEEAIDHALAAEATVVVAINKCDLPAANVDRVKKDLAEHGLASEDWGGKIITVPVSAKTGQGIDQLVEMLLLEAELLELKADPTSPARGTVVEAELSKASGAIATFLVQDGTLKTGDTVVCGNFYGKVRAMINEHGKRVPEAPPSSPVRVLGLSGVPSAGDVFYVVKDEVKAREWINERLERDRNKNLAGPSHITLDALYAEIKAGKLQTLKLILKADVQGSVEALKNIIGQIPADKIKLQIIHTGTGNITHSDVMLAAASNAVIVGFHVDITADGETTAKREEVDVRLYEIIYEAKAAIEKALEGMLEPEKREVQIGSAEVRQVFKLSKSGVVAGSMVTKGKIVRNAMCRVLRKGVKVHEGKVSGLKRFKNDAREVAEGFECGISIDNFEAFLPGDEIRVLEVEFKAQTLKN